jgi:hypothetical protein
VERDRTSYQWKAIALDLQSGEWKNEALTHSMAMPIAVASTMLLAAK